MAYMLSIFEKIPGAPNYHSVGFEPVFAPGEDLGYRSAWMLRPKPLSDDHIKRFVKKIKITHISNGPSQDIIAAKESLLIVSERAMAEVERLEPNTHQFIEQEVLYPKKYAKHFEGVRYFFMHVRQAMNAVVIEKSSVRKSEVYGAAVLKADPSLEEIYAYSPEGMNSEDFVVTIDPAKAARSQIWTGVEFVFSHSLFVSDALKEAWESRDIGPVNFIKCAEI